MITRTDQVAAGTALGMFFIVAICAALGVRTVQQHHLQRQVSHAISALAEGAIYGGDGTTIMQQQRNDCGIAALLTVLQTRGVQENLDSLRTEIKLSQQGASLLQLRKVAEAHGVRAVSWSLTMSDLRDAPLPAILFVHGDHFVVLVRFVNPFLVEIHDPALGRLYVPTVSLEHSWSGECLIFDDNWSPKS